MFNSLRPHGLIVRQVPLSMEFSRQEYWRGLPLFFPGDLPDPGIKPRCPSLQADSLSSEPPGKPPYDVKKTIKTIKLLNIGNHFTVSDKIQFLLISWKLYTATREALMMVRKQSKL